MDEMSPRSSRIISAGVALAAVGAIVGGSIAFGSVVNPAPEPTRVVQTNGPASEPVPFVAPISEEDEQIAEAAREAARIEAERIAAEKAAAEEAARIAAEEEAARLAAEEATRQSQSVGGQTQTRSGGSSGTSPAPAPAAPIRCPAGSTSMSFDGTNDTSCLPVECLNGTVDSSRPECQTPFRP